MLLVLVAVLVGALLLALVRRDLGAPPSAPVPRTGVGVATEAGSTGRDPVPTAGTAAEMAEPASASAEPGPVAAASREQVLGMFLALPPAWHHRSVPDASAAGVAGAGASQTATFYRGALPDSADFVFSLALTTPSLGTYGAVSATATDSEALFAAQRLTRAHAESMVARGEGWDCEGHQLVRLGRYRGVRCRGRLAQGRTEARQTAYYLFGSQAVLTATLAGQKAAGAPVEAEVEAMLGSLEGLEARLSAVGAEPGGRAASSGVLLPAARAYYEQARGDVGRGDLETARDHFLAATGMQGDFTEAWYNLGATYGNLAIAAARRGSDQQAVQLFRQAVDAKRRAKALMDQDRWYVYQDAADQEQVRHDVQEALADADDVLANEASLKLALRLWATAGGP